VPAIDQDYLKQIGKVALLNAAEGQAGHTKIEAGLFAQRRTNWPI
jgi:hypothetical protein